jgi:hypothetical protein
MSSEIFEDESPYTLKAQLNKFLEKIDENQIIKILYSTSHSGAGAGYSITNSYSVLIIYREKTDVN